MRFPAVAKAFTRSALACALTAMLPAFAALNPAVMPDTGPMSAQAMARMNLAGAARAGNRVVAVGDRGYIVYSDDDGKSWLRAAAPANLPLLTAVRFFDAKTGWAVGHDATILKSVDQGQTWTQVFSAPSEQKPLMDILFVDADNGFAVGAYGSCYETRDAGKSWNPRKVFPVSAAAPAAKAAAGGRGGARGDIKAPEDDKHLNSIVKVGPGKLLISGEAGTLLRSEDNGKTWTKLVSPYKGSYFGAVDSGDGAVLVYGMRGKIFRADAAMRNWAPVESKTTASLMGSTQLPDGAIVLAGQAGTVLVSHDQGRTFQPLPTGSTKAYSTPVLGAPNVLMLLGEAGAREVPLPSAPK